MDITIFEKMIGKTANSVENNDDYELVFDFDDGTRLRFYHSQDCCELVYIEDVVGDLTDLVDSPILQAEEVVYTQENPEGVKVREHQDCFTWTFYKFATNKGAVTVRWYGESNGYYSERVDHSWS